MKKHLKSHFYFSNLSIKFFYTILLLSFNFLSVFAQNEIITLGKDTLKTETLDPLRSAKAAFYSAIVPGLGQVYNKQYWKVPLVYGAMGTSLYFYLDSKKSYNTYRDVYKNRLKGEGSGSVYLDKLSIDQLIQIQNLYKRNVDLSALFVVGFYVLNIIDANVAAALSQFNVNDKLAINPKLNKEESYKTYLGFQAVYSF